MRPFALTFLGLFVLAALLPAQDGPGSRRAASVRHAFERIEKSLREIRALPTLATDAEAAELVASIEESSRRLRERLLAEEAKPQLLFEMRLIDLEAAGAEKAWHERFGLRPVRPLAVEGDLAARLADFPGLLAAPKILVQDGQEATIAIGEDREFSYLERTEGGLYRVATRRIAEGLVLKVRGRLDAERRIDTALEVERSRITGRTEFEPEVETVGLPILDRNRAEARLRLAAGERTAVMPGGPSSNLVLILGVSELPAAEPSGR